MKEYIDLTVLDNIINKTAYSIKESKKEIFEISERSRQEISHFTQELHHVKMNLTLMINEVDKLEIRSKMTRNMIQTISDHFEEFTEKDIRDAYDLSEKVQVELTNKRKEEKALIDRRNELEQLLMNAYEVVGRAEALETKVSVALDYLASSLGEELKDQRMKKDVGIRIIEAQENEKKRISRDIHDGPAQSLANIIYKSEYASKIIDTSPNKAKKEISEIQESIRKTLKDIRRVIYDLMPMSLDDLGLIPTLNRLINDMEDMYNIKVHFNYKIEGALTNEMVKLMVFRIVQECFNNIAKHSKCSNVDFAVSVAFDTIRLAIKDDGIGFNVDEKLENPTGYGLYNMRERVELLNGVFNITSINNKGTTIKVQIPNNE